MKKNEASTVMNDHVDLSGISPCDGMEVVDLGNPKELQRLMFRRQSSMRLIMSNCRSSLQFSLSYLYWSQSRRVSSILRNKLQDQRYYINKLVPQAMDSYLDGLWKIDKRKRVLTGFNIFLLLEKLNIASTKMGCEYDDDNKINSVSNNYITIQTIMASLNNFHTQQSILIASLLAQHDANQRIDSLRQNELVRQQKYIRRQSSEVDIHDISDKLNRLEKTLLKKNPLDKPNNDLSSNGKYEQLNAINERLRVALCRMSSKKTKGNVQSIEKSIIGLYNESVRVLNNQSKLNSKLSSLKHQNQNILLQIGETKKEIDNASTQLQSILSLKELNLKRLQRMSKCAFLFR